MKFSKKQKQYKKCPRCGNKCLINQSKCEECDLLFSRLQYASNSAAKKKLRHFDNDYVIYTSDLPKDVKWWKLLLLTIFTGIFGGHYYYVGKYIKGGLMTATFVYLIFCTIFNAQMVAYLETYYLYLPIGISALAWIVSLVYVLSRKFKVPILVDIPQSVQVDMNLKRADYDRVRSELESENAKLKEEKKVANDNDIAPVDACAIPTKKQGKTEKVAFSNDKNLLETDKNSANSDDEAKKQAKRTKEQRKRGKK